MNNLYKNIENLLDIVKDLKKKNKNNSDMMKMTFPEVMELFQNKKNDSEQKLYNYLDNLAENDLYVLTNAIYFGRSIIDNSLIKNDNFIDYVESGTIRKNKDSNLESIYEKRYWLNRYLTEFLKYNKEK